MKKILFVLPLLLVLFCKAAKAGDSVYETAQGSGTVTSVSVTSVTITNMDNSVRLLPNRFAIEIFNDDATNNLFCNFNTVVSSVTTSANYGRRIGPRASWTVNVPKVGGVYCTSDAGALAVITQLW